MKRTWNDCTALLLLLIASIALPVTARATETENLGLRVLPAPGKVTVDGKTDDWDLTGGIFACSDVENATEKYGVWLHAMYDRDNLYILARWLDPTPMNNPGSSKGDYGFRGDCLQFRIVTAPDVTSPDVKTTDKNAKDAANVRTTHATCWIDRDKLDVVDLEYGRLFNEGKLGDAKKNGAAQAFLEDPDHKGYVQEIALPWKLLVKDGVEMKPGAKLLMTFEPNFTVGGGGARLTVKDLFKPGVTPDRVFTFQGNGSWGYVTLEPAGKVAPQPVRLSDRREFAVHMEGGLPVVDWTGLARSRLPEGFKSIKLNVPQDGYVSLNLFASDGTVARQLLTCQFLNKGEHDIEWDGLTTPSAHRPGVPVPSGSYTWEAIFHTGIGLKLRGWAANSGDAPWHGWGADHGNPVAAASAGDQVFLGWNGGEGDKPLQACDLNGHIQWKNIRGGIASAGPIATDGTTVYAFNNIGQYAARAIYRVDARTGRYTEWSALKNTDLSMKDLWPEIKDPKEVPEAPSGLAAGGGKVFVSFDKQNAVLVVDANTGRVTKKLAVPKASGVAVDAGGRLYVISSPQVLAVDVESGQTQTFAKPELGPKDWPSAVTTDAEGNVYVGVRGGNQQVLVYGRDGKLLRTIGRKGGRSLHGPWTPDGMLNVAGLAVDREGKLWVAEDDGTPKRVSVWDSKTGNFKAEHFGASSYGAIGAAINPRDPYLMVGQGCEWRIDPQTGLSTCLGTITREGMGASRFGTGQNGKQYLAITPAFLGGPDVVDIYERLGDAKYIRRSTLRRVDGGSPGSAGKGKHIEVWSDANGDGEEQPDEVKRYDIDLGGWLAGWYMPMTPDLTFYGSLYQVKVTGWTACGAPLYDLAQAAKLPAPPDARLRGGMGAQHGHGSSDGRYMLWNGGYGEDHTTLDCFDIQSGRKVWSYPDNFTGVHGSHRAIPAEPGLIRGAYDITGVAKLPAPVGDIWVIPTNKGEWHVLTEKGFYLTRLFEGDPTKNVWPAIARPGARIDNCPPGAGEEAFGGSIAQETDGTLSVQAGHISYWNAQVTGLETIRALPGGKIDVTPQDVTVAQTFRERYLQGPAVAKKAVAHKATVAFTGDLDRDFAGADVLKYEKGDATACRSALAWDDKNLYVAWDVKDPTPWLNGADAPEFMYTRGDSVDLQLGTDPAAPKDRKEAALGDVRISVGPFNGRPTVVVYRRQAKEKHPKFFSSGVEKGYEMQSVVVLNSAKVQVKVSPESHRYIVELALPLSDLDLALTDGMTLHGDIGVTHSDQAGNDTALRTYWSNQDTGLVSDEVFELKMTPATWGEIEFRR